MTDLRTAAQQALEYMKSIGQMDMYPEDWAIVGRLEAALAQQAWVCPESPEHRYAKPGHCEDCGRTLVRAQQAYTDDLNQRIKLYVGSRCAPPQQAEQKPCSTDPRAPHGFDRTASHTAGRYVCECEHWQAEPVGTRALIEECRAALAEPTVKESLQVESVVAENATTQQQIEQTPPSEYRRGYWDGFRIGKREGRIEAEDEPAQQAEPVQEPVAWRFEARHIDSAWAAAVTLKHPGPEGVYMRNVKPLYTSPPQRPVEPVQEPVQCEPQYANEDGWCEWVCPKPVGYLMQCCDCGLIHEVESRVAKYEPLPSEMFEVVDDPDLQAQWRMKRRDDISPKQAPQRPAEPVQEPVAKCIDDICSEHLGRVEAFDHLPRGTLLYAAPPQRKPLTEEEIPALAEKAWKPSVYCDAEALLGTDGLVALVRAVEAKHCIKE